ncbi:MAG: hypothetical protein JOZ78_03655 [Chroococcidiopsidaceae cyanobacterium CP_BM_ER_R8_30]|nr:hypothetical protein [Chroococcidiopsidaceae cyanobacterium CP_BM_ER_R8_30]
MNRVIHWLRNVGIRQIVTVFLATLTFLVVPAFSHSQVFQAQAARSDVYTESKPVDSGTVKRIKEKAEDLGDAPGRRIGNTGLGNIKQLGKKIPETIDLNARQTKEIVAPSESDRKAALDKAQKQAKRDFNDD